MRQLKITKSVSDENELSRLPISQFESSDDRLACAESKFEKRTGLKEGAKVRYIGVSDKLIDYLGSSYSDPRSILDSETIYEIEYIVIGRSYTIVKLVGFREEEFSGAIFQAVDNTEAKKYLNVGDIVRYIGGSEQNIKQHSTLCSNPHDMLDYESVYKVKSIERHPAFIGHTVVRLIGFDEEIFHRILFEKVITTK
ncbi:hypothetical protein EZS27_028295 [termite gut metagenome]|uniref:Uncharacterized protein n=1 Tax=termite gut metagenome TaxID=433724 RepID=A0A5J4QMC8_9ZZZZ